MKTKDLPEWFIEYLEDHTGFIRRTKMYGAPYDQVTQSAEAVIEFYKFISKPENQAKMLETRALIEALEAIRPHVGDGETTPFFLHRALKPFKVLEND